VTLIGDSCWQRCCSCSCSVLCSVSRNWKPGLAHSIVVGAACALVALWLRRALAETEEFQAEAARKVKRSPLRELLQHPREVGIVIGLTLGGTVAFYTYSTYMLKFLINTVGSAGIRPRPFRPAACLCSCSFSP